MFLALLPAVLVVAVAGVFRWLLFTESGARFVWQHIAESVPGELSAGRVDGALKTRLRLYGVRYRDGDLGITLDRGELSLDLDLWPLALSLGELRLGELAIDLPPASPEPGDPAAALEALALPFPVEFEQVEVQRAVFTETGTEPFLEVVGLFARVDWFRSIRIERLQADLPGAGVRMEGRADLGLTSPFDAELDMRASSRGGALGLEAPLALEVRLSGDLSDLQLEALVAEPRVSLTGTVENLLATGRWDLTLQSPRLSWPPGVSDTGWNLQELVLHAYGAPGSYEVEASAELLWEGGPPVGLRVLGTGDPDGLVFERIGIDSDWAVGSGPGSVQWTPEVTASARVEVERLDPRPWWTDWGEAPPASGQVAIHWRGNRLEIEDLSLSAPGTAERLAGSTTIDFKTGELAADLQWTVLSWPPAAEAPLLSSQQGRGALSGRLDAWRFDGDLELAGTDVPAGRLRLSAIGDREGLSFEAPSGEVLGGRFSARGAVRWAPRLDWNAEASVEKLQTGPLVPELPGWVSGRVSAAGRPEEDHLELAFEPLSGVIRERQVRATGALSWTSGRLQADRLMIRSSASEITLHGSPRGAAGLEARARVASLGDFLDGARGQLAGEAWIRWAGTGAPELRLDLDGEGLAWQGWSLGRLEARSDEAPESRLLLQLSDLEAGERRVDSLRAESFGGGGFEQVDLLATLPGGQLGARLEQGRFDWSSGLDGAWQGRLAHLFVESREPAGRMDLEESAPLQLSRERLQLEDACLRGPREGRICLQASLQPGGERIVQASLERISPNTLLSFSGLGLALSHRVSGAIAWRQLPAARPTAQVDVAISPGDLRFEGEEQPVLQTGAGFFGFAIEDGRLHSGQFTLPLAEGGGINMDFGVPDLSQGLDSELRGRLLLELGSIEPLLELTASLEGQSGPLTADMRFSGTLGDPRFTGYLSLVRGRILHFPTGLLLEDLQLAGAVYQFDQTDLRGSFRAGEGRGTVRAVMNFDDMLAPAFRVELEGENLRLVDVPDLRVEANPDVVLTWREDTLQVNGRVKVPMARLSPRYLPTSGVNESPDAVIVAGVDPLAAEEAAESRDWKVRGKLALELGQDVEIALDRARARLSGKTSFTWRGDPLPMANGGFSLSGEINAYGQLLRVEEGRVSFSGRPADNPFLNIRAERDIFGNSQIRTAGVLVTGSLRNPVLEPYTTPLTTRERAMALLVTGSDFDYEQGVGAVQVGMYVAPRLYVSYGVGLFDDQNVISARYELSRGFSVRATSGQREAGVDIDYTVEH